MNLKPKKIEVTPILSEPIEELNTPIPKPVDLEIDSEQMLKKSEPIEDIDILKEKLIQLGIRFNTAPHNYTKRDYLYLIKVLYRSLLHLYKGDINLAPVAYSGDIADLIQKEYFILDCGSST